MAFLYRRVRFFLFAFCLLPLTFFLLLLCLVTTLRHAIDRGRRLRVAMRRPATLILQLLTIRLVAFQQNIGAAARRKIPSNRGFSISNLNQGMTCA